MNLKINHRLGVVNVRFFSGFQLNKKFDSVASTFSVNFYYDPKNKEHAELACVSHFHEAIFEHNGEVLLTGFILSQVFKSSPKKQLVKLAGYSKAGVLEDCEIPPTLYPLQTDGLSIAQIANKILSYFKLKMIIDPSVADKMNTAISSTTASSSQKIKGYLTELCRQRNIIISHDVDGNVLFTKAKTDMKPLFHVEKGLIATDIELNFSGQGLHSDITIMKEASPDGGNAGEYTIQNPYVPIVYRPKVLPLTSGDENTVEDAAMNALAAELKDITLTINTDRWEVDGKVIQENNIITVYCPECYLYKKTEWFIESVSFTGDPQKQTAVLTCVLPEVYNGKMPKNIFVDAHENLPRI